MPDKTKYHYIAYRRRDTYLYYSGIMGGFPVNSDDRLWNSKGAPFVLSLFDRGVTAHYAVKDEDAEAVIERILEHCGEGSERPIYKQIRNDSPEAVTEITMGDRHYELGDASLLKAWFDELKGKCGEPLSERELYHYTHPAPAPVTGPVSVLWIIEQATVPPQPPSLPVPPPDRCRSILELNEDAAGGRADSAKLTVYSAGKYYKYIVPASLLPEVNAGAAELLAHPADGYHQNWDAAAWIRIREREEEIDVDPEGVLALFEKLLPKCEAVTGDAAGGASGPAGGSIDSIVSKPAGPIPGPIGYRSNKDINTSSIPGFIPGGMMWAADQMMKTMERKDQATNSAPQTAFPGTQSDGASSAAQPAADPGSWTCPMCGAHNAGKFCSECGTPKPQQVPQ